MAEYQKIVTTTTLTNEQYMVDKEESGVWTPMYNRRSTSDEVIIVDVSPETWEEVAGTVQPALPPGAVLQKTV